MNFGRGLGNCFVEVWWQCSVRVWRLNHLAFNIERATYYIYSYLLLVYVMPKGEKNGWKRGGGGVCGHDEGGVMLRHLPSFGRGKLCPENLTCCWHKNNSMKLFFSKKKIFSCCAFLLFLWFFLSLLYQKKRKKERQNKVWLKNASIIYYYYLWCY